MKLKSFGDLIKISLVILSISSCKEELEVAVVSTNPVANISATSASSGGNVTFDNGSMITERGVCWSIETNPTIENFKTSDGAGEGPFTSALNSLIGGTNYYIRAFAINKAGVGYGNELSFRTLGQSPLPIIMAASNINTISAILNGNVNPNYLSTDVIFEYGLTLNYGSTINASQSPISGSSAANVNATISGLTEGTIYHFRIKAVNSLGTTYSNDITFTTLGKLPDTSLQIPTSINTNSATLLGTINANYLSTVVTFEFGKTTNYESSLAADQSPLIGNVNTHVSVRVSGLEPSSTYHYRLKAVNKIGTTVTNDGIFNTLTPLIDIDGNVYDIITIGSQTWMSENLNTTKYSNGDVIGTTTPYALDIRSESTPKYQWAFDGNEANALIYGRIYTWYVATDARNICPQAWHVPSDNDWSNLTTFLGGINVAGGKLKEKGTAHWTSPNTGATNESGFSAIAGGNRWSEGSFHYMGWYGIYWSSTSYNSTDALPRELAFDSNKVILINYPKKDGFSIRCIKD
jgi:uncharacterized protein (TIGR02145 family)